jgi:hypothetical protein
MKRLGLVMAGLALAGAVNTADAQLVMQMSNGWNFTFAGNVNAFMMYASQNSDGNITSDGARTGSGDKGFFLGTGLLPAFATFAASGKEGNTDLGVHFGFAPQIQCGRRGSSASAHDCFGAQIDMRQVYLTVGGEWGDILAGRELALFGRQAILNDQTLFGIGATAISPSGTTLGRIGFGYLYPNFVAQFTYSTKAGKPGRFRIGLFDPSGLDNTIYTQTQVPRIEAEFTYRSGGFLGWVDGTLQNAKDPVSGGFGSKTATGFSGGLKFGKEKFSLTGTGYWGKGIGTTLQFSGIGVDGVVGGLGVGADGELRTSYGGYVQGTVTAGKSTIAASWGFSALSATDGELAPATGSLRTENSLVSVGLYNQMTKSLKWVVEGNYQWSDTKGSLRPTGTEKNTQVTIGTGLMLFY